MYYICTYNTVGFSFVEFINFFSFVCPSNPSRSNSLASSGIYRICVSSHDIYINASLGTKKIQYIGSSMCPPRPPKNTNFTFDKLSTLISLAHGFMLNLSWLW